MNAKLNMKSILIIELFFVFCLAGIISCQQSVARKCLAQIVNQRKDPNRNQGNAPQQPVDPADANIIRIFESICGNTDRYIQCFGRGLNVSQQPVDFFLSLLHNPPSMRGTYQGFCNDMQEIRPRVQCLHITPPVQRCYDEFNQAVNQIALTRNQARIDLLRTLACNVSVSRYNCEINVYRQCDARIGQIMSDFLYGGLPVRCQVQTGVSSLYTQLYGGAESLSLRKSLLVFVLVFGVMWFWNTTD